MSKLLWPVEDVFLMLTVTVTMGSTVLIIQVEYKSLICAGPRVKYVQRSVQSVFLC